MNRKQRKAAKMDRRRFEEALLRLERRIADHASHVARIGLGGQILVHGNKIDSGAFSSVLGPIS